MFDSVENIPIAEREEKILSFWKSQKIFEKSIENRKNSNHFSFYDGPPFATGMPHYGNLLASILKDVIPRYKTMKGFHVPRRFGWDCHGLPVENEIEKSLNVAGAHAIETYGIDKFNEACRSIVLRYASQWEGIINRIGRWVDFGHTYRTMDPAYMESVWWVFKQLFDKGYVYEGYKVMPFSAKLGTPLSNFEAGLNYQEVDDPSVTVAFKVEKAANTFLLVWTTTPWTLVSNLAATVNPDIEYVKVLDKASNYLYILAKARLSAYYKETSEYEIVDTYLGKDIVGMRYEPLFPYFKEHKALGAFRVIGADFVSTEDGTGIVHTAPGFGEDDFYACQRENIEPVCPVDNNGCFTEEISEYKGLFVKEADKDIIKRIKAQGQLIQQKTFRHRYPFCWRTDSPLIYRAMSSWFVAVEKIKETMIGTNQQIYWMPEHIKNHRFGKWLEGARDWAISRNRYWGTPLPLWRSECGDLMAIGSIQELEQLVGASINDLHRHHIDHLTFTKDGKTYKRVPEVFDCWFESGSMPYAQNHYPFENKELFENTFPADFIAEGIDQTRGWFYTLTVLAAALFQKPAFKNVIVNGIILAEDGNKMSKRLKNYPEPKEVLNKYGADAVRLYLLHSPVVHADDMRFREQGVEEVMRRILLPLWNSYSFFITYATIYKWEPSQQSEASNALIDKWIISRLSHLISDVEKAMDAYDLSKAVEPFVRFIEELTNWYIRRSRRRFWEDEDTPDRRGAFTTLYHVLKEFTKVVAPFIPFISESIHQNLKTSQDPESVHLCDYPSEKSYARDQELEDLMGAIQTAVSLGHSLRKEKRVKVRQPLKTLYLAVPDRTVLRFFQDQEHLIKEELNVKDIVLTHDESQFVELTARPNYRVLGKKVGQLMPKVKKEIEMLPIADIEFLIKGKEIVITCEGQTIPLTPEDIEVSRSVKEGLVAANSGEITVGLDLTLTDDLIKEGIARELVNKIQTMRREAQLNKTDRIYVSIETSEEVSKSYQLHEAYIKHEVLAHEIQFTSGLEGTEWDINGNIARIAIVKHS